MWIESRKAVLRRSAPTAKKCWLGARRLTGAYLPQSHASKVFLSMSEQFLPEPALDVPIVFVDLETTGGSTSEHRITEVGVVEIGPAGVSRWSSLVDPQQPIPSFIQQLTGITNAMVRGAPTFESIAPALFERLNGKLFVAHNASFDRGFLRGEFRRAGLAFDPDVLCTVRLSRALFPAEKRHGLDALVERHGLVPSDRHRALADADLIWQFWQRLHGGLVPLDVLQAQIERTTRRYRLAGDITEDLLDTAPAGCGVYAFYGEGDLPLYVGRSVRLRQRLRSHLTGQRRRRRICGLRCKCGVSSGGRLAANWAPCSSRRSGSRRCVPAITGCRASRRAIRWMRRGRSKVQSYLRSVKKRRTRALFTLSTGGVTSGMHLRSRRRRRCTRRAWPGHSSYRPIVFCRAILRAACV